MPDETQAINEAAEEVVVDTPTTETTPTEAQPGTDAGDTGDIQVADAGETEEERGPVPYERFREVNERAKAAADLESRVKFYEDVLSDPAVRGAAVAALQQKEQGGAASPADAVEARVGQILAEEIPGYTLEDLSLGEQVAIRRAARAELMVESTQQADLQRTGERDLGVYSEHIGALAKAAGLVLGDEERATVDKLAAAIVRGYAQTGAPVDPKEVAELAFNATQGQLVKARSARQARTAEVTTTKAEITEGRPGGVPTVPGEAPVDGEGREITENLYDRIFKTP